MDPMLRGYRHAGTQKDAGQTKARPRPDRGQAKASGLERYAACADCMSKHTSEHTPEHMSERMSKHMSERLSERRSNQAHLSVHA